MGPWRLLGVGARGSYGIVFRAERAAQPEAGVFALKLARQPGDPRFELEVELLSRGDESPPCPGESYEWQKRCYLPAFGPPSPATSEKKEKPPHGLTHP